MIRYQQWREIKLTTKRLENIAKNKEKKCKQKLLKNEDNND